MKLVRKYIDKKNEGSVALIAEEAEDMWHAYNLINEGDYVRATTVRKVVNESAVGMTTTSRVSTTLTLLVKSIDYDTQASVLRVRGTNEVENQFVKKGAYHTIDLELNKKFEITKREWDSVALSRLDEACDPSQNADLAAVVMQEGLANVCLILSSMTLVKAKIEMNIPRKRKGMCANHDKSLEKFYERIVQALLTHINFDIVKAVIVASPGFIKDQFLVFMNEYAVKNAQSAKVLIDNKSKFILVHSASGFKHSLKEVFEDPALSSRLSDTKALGEVKKLDDFYQMLKVDPNRAFYGYKHVKKASEADAIDVLLISDSLFRSRELAERKKYVQIVDGVRDNNGQVKIFSSLHVSGEQLLQLTGIAAILRFPMPELEDELLSDSDDESDDSNQASGGINNNKVVPNPADSYIDDEAMKSDETEQATSSKPNASNLKTGSDSNSSSNVSISNAGATASTSTSKVNTTTSSNQSKVSGASNKASAAATSTAKNSSKKTKKTNKENYYDDYDEYDNYDDYDNYY